MNEKPHCTRCGSDQASYFREYSGEKLCTRCFKKSFEKRTVRTIAKYNMLRYDDKIAVAVSGGKDSLSLLHLLNKIEHGFPQSKLVAITVDEGISEYRDEAMEIAESKCIELGVNHKTTSFEEMFGHTLDEIVATRSRKGVEPHPCTVCGVLRRKALNTAARQLSIDVLATAHTLDDILQTHLLNILRGDTSKPWIDREQEKESYVPRVTPFKLTPEKEVAYYAYLNGLYAQETPCKYAKSSSRNDVRNFLNVYEEKHPGAMFTALKTMEKTWKKQDRRRTGKCRICGDPTARGICRACEILSTLS